jgi:hypothetical protein
MGLPKDRTRAFATRLQTCVLVTPKQCSFGERDIGDAYLSAMSRNKLERHQYANIVNHSLVASCNTAILADEA